MNLPALRSHNAALVLGLLRAAGADGISRLELAERTGLTPQAVSKITARLRADGLAAEAGRRASTGGKPRTVLRLMPGAGHAIGVHLDRDELRAVLVDLAGTVVAERCAPLDLGAGAETVLEAVGVVAEGVVRDAGLVVGGSVGGGGLVAGGPVRGGGPVAEGPVPDAQRVAEGSGRDAGTVAGGPVGDGGPVAEGPVPDAQRVAEGSGRDDGTVAEGPVGDGGPVAEGPVPDAQRVAEGLGRDDGPGTGGPVRDVGPVTSVPPAPPHSRPLTRVPTLLGVGVALPGPLDHVDGVLHRVTGFPEWDGFPLRDALAGRLGVPVVVDKDTNAAALGLAAAGEGGAFAYLHLATGLGAGLVIGGAVHRGPRTGAGEFGHQVIALDGPPCPCGNRGCVEVLCLDAVARGEVAEAARVLGVGAANLVGLLDIDLVLLGGRTVTAAPEVFVRGVGAVLDAHARRGGGPASPVPVRLAPGGARGVAEGAAQLLLAPLFGRADA
ncbi:ROK family transcriptional regulator [Streptomyces sp. enrichment culture]|uniref:ROK family transcriptional regulator n=1 Tax=Streptomyces sp. enrichment culture TaxID=1795815 RepID=UPI003F54859B